MIQKKREKTFGLLDERGVNERVGLPVGEGMPFAFAGRPPSAQLLTRPPQCRLSRTMRSAYKKCGRLHLPNAVGCYPAGEETSRWAGEGIRDADELRIIFQAGELRTVNLPPFFFSSKKIASAMPTSSGGFRVIVAASLSVRVRGCRTLQKGWTCRFFSVRRPKRGVKKQALRNERGTRQCTLFRALPR
ncbi:MAG: hypothetical protein LBQ33_04705 [Oscillospiraceae bacterium]|jgi:hypothetical protein|nr:hypothetical protein [Oscillospiraceae bacterium]